jgi:surface antigen
MASPVFGRVATSVPSTIIAGPIVSRRGVPCQRVTQMIDIGGRNVHASAMLCRQSDGKWRIETTQSARLGETMPP